MTDQNHPSGDVSREFIEQARKFLRDDYLPKIERCLEDLNDEQVWWRPNPESNSIGNLILHLCGNARQWIVSGLAAGTDQRVRQAEFDQRAIVPRSELLGRLRETLAEVDRVLEAFNRERLLDRYQIQEYDVTALEAIFHVTEHFSMHTGQIIFITKLLTSHDLRFYDL
ncbi:MAG: DinB family protein [Pyrinomonadaceae bacterium]